MPNGDIYPCHMYAVDRNYCLGTIINELNFHNIKQQLDNLPLKNKNNYIECQSCWARKFCHLCPANTLISSEEVAINEDVCNKRRRHYEKMLLKSIFYKK